MSSREIFLARVKEAAHAGRPYSVHVPPLSPEVGYLGVSEDLVARFAKEVNAVGGEAFVVSDRDACRTTLSRLLQEAGAASALCWQHELLSAIGLEELLTTFGVAQWNYQRLCDLPASEQRRQMLTCDVGITSCTCAIAETGTLLMAATPHHERLASLLPPMHIAIIERSQILPDLIDAVAQFQERPQLPQQMTNDQGQATLPSNLTLITGPSKTGDIELQLTTGVHGPGKWRVIILQGKL